MSFRRAGKLKHIEARSWAEWLDLHAPDLTACGIPTHVLNDEDHWWDFLHHGYLDHHPDPTSFSVRDVPRDKVAHLVMVLESIIPQEQWNSAIALLQLREMAGDGPA